ncbi:hypothetical protein Gpo141_00008934 [Globisporangium polare]
MAHEAHGSDLFRIRRIFSLAPSGPQENETNEQPQLKIEAMAVHTLEKKQLLAMSVAEDDSDQQQSAALSSATAAPAKPAPAPASSAPAIALGRLPPSIEPRKPRIPPVVASNNSDAEKKKKQKAKESLLSAANYLLVRTIEEDQRARFWKFPVRTNSKQQSAGKSEKLVALEFSPEGDWLAGLSSRKNRLHLIPVLKLIARQRKQLLDATYAPPHNRELMSVHQSVMNTQMASYLRATNEAGGLNGARYHSQVAGDDEQMSTLEFAIGIGTVTCLRWWRSMNSKNYCLVGGTENLISIVNVEENAEECRCELQNAGTIVSIDLFRENFRKEKRTTMLVKALGDDRVTRYYRVVLEKKYQVQQKAKQQQKGKQTSIKNLLTPSASMDDSDTAAEQSVTAVGSATVASSFVSSSGTQSFTTVPSITTQSSFSRANAPPQYVVKTFPQHFLEDMDFRPQRIKKNSPQICLYAINGMLTSESSLALYDPNSRRASLYSNFQWTLRNEYVIPSLAPTTVADLDATEETKEDGDQEEEEEKEEEAVVDIEVSYCTTDLLLLQGRTETSKQNVSTWISLPSHNGQDDDQVANAHIVHYLSLHENEKIERVVQSTSRSSPVGGQAGGADNNSSTVATGGDQPDEAQVIYLLQTQHHVYECRPQWSRLALFKTLCAQSITLRNALSIGYALGIDMASLCQVVAETLCENIHKSKSGVSSAHVAADDRTVQWVRDLFEVSRAMPSSAIEQLTSIGGARYAIDYAQQILTAETSSSSVFIDSYEKKKVALQLLDLVLREQLHANVSSSLDSDEQSLRPRDVDVQTRLEDKEKWVLNFLETSGDYDTEAIVDLCLSHLQVDKAVMVGKSRNQVHLVLQKIIHAGLTSFVSTKALRSLVAAGFASELTSVTNRLVLRAFPLDTQVEVLLAHPPAILQQRDWLLRNLPAISAELCKRIAQSIDPRVSGDSSQSLQATTGEQTESFAAKLVDVAAAEAMPTSPEERVELFLTTLLRLNRDVTRNESSDQDPVDEDDDKYSQTKLETLMKELARQYRPPVMVARCVDYGNWTAAASLFEAHDELVEAVEARLHSHKVLRPVSAPLSPSSSTMSSSPASFTPLPSSPALTFSALRRRRQSSDASVDSNNMGSTGALSDESEFQDTMREELFQLLDSLVVQRHRRQSERTITEETKAAILARLLVKWFEYGLPKTELEVFLIDPKVYPFVASLLAKIFFSEVVDGILGGSQLTGSKAAAASTGGSGALAQAGGFDDRDREWVRKCHYLPFSGQFLFHVCVSFLDSNSHDEGKDDEAATSLNTTALSSFSSQRRTATLKLLDLVKENVVKNDLAIEAVRIEPHSAQALGKSDPLETHVKVFSCGHVFPKRVFDEEVLPEFDRRLNALPLPLFTTKQVLAREFRGSGGVVEAPCPVCAFNRISSMVRQQFQQQSAHKKETNVNSRVKSAVVVARAKAPRAEAAQPELYFLHAATQSRPPQQQASSSYLQQGASFNDQPRKQSQWSHEGWEWRASP